MDELKLANLQNLSNVDSALADEYDKTQTYNTTDIVRYEGNLYRCISNTDEDEDWTEAHWQQINNAVTYLDNLNYIISNYYDADSTYAVGDIVRYEESLYKCKTAIETAEAWTASHWDEIGSTIIDLLGNDSFTSAFTSTTARGAIMELYDAYKNIDALLDKLNGTTT